MTTTQSGKEVVLKVDAEGRVRTPKEKQEEILAAYGGSRMTGQQFAAFCGVTALCRKRHVADRLPRVS